MNSNTTQALVSKWKRRKFIKGSELSNVLDLLTTTDEGGQNFVSSQLMSWSCR